MKDCTDVHVHVISNHCNINFPDLTFSVTAALAVTLLAIKGELACCSPFLDPKCTLTVLGWTWVKHKLLGAVVLCSP